MSRSTRAAATALSCSTRPHSVRLLFEATIVTSNKSLTEWGRVLHDSAVAAALVDRLMHHGDVYYVKGESYRVRGKPRTEVVPEVPPPDPLPLPITDGVRENPEGSSSP